MTTAWLLLLALDGQVVNRTTGQPVPNAGVTLIKAGQGGMQPAGTVRTGADGRFAFEGDIGADAMGLLQVSHQGVTYTKMVAPMAPKQGVEITVFDQTTNASVAKVDQHMMVYEHTPGELRASETIMLRNDSNTTWANPAGTVKFYVPPMANGKVQVRATAGAQGMPLNRPAKPTGEANIYSVDFPVKPGETRVDISWTAPFAAPADITGRILHPEPAMLVVPRGMSLKGAKLVSKGVEPRTQASIYEVAQGAFTALVEGAGTIRNQAAEDEKEEDGGTPVDIIPPKIYDSLYWILGLSFAILGLSFYKLFRSPSA